MATGPIDHDGLRDQAGVYVLGALTARERDAFEMHLATCAECAAEVKSLMPVAGALAQLAPQVDPPEALRARLLTSIGPSGERERPRAGRPVEDRDRVRTAGAGVGAWGPWLAVAASLVLTVAFAVYAAGLKGQVATLEARLREAMRRADASELQIADARREATEARSQVAVLAAPDLTRVDLAGRPVAPRAAARAFWSRSRGLVFTASNLPALPPGRTYQLWVISKGKAPYGSGLLLKPDADGRVTMVFDTPVDLSKPNQMAVTIEPEGGVPSPTGDMYLLGSAN